MSITEVPQSYHNIIRKQDLERLEATAKSLGLTLETYLAQLMSRAIFKRIGKEWSVDG